MGSHYRHLTDDNFTGNEVRTHYRQPEPSLSARLADAVGAVCKSLLSAFGMRF